MRSGQSQADGAAAPRFTLRSGRLRDEAVKYQKLVKRKEVVKHDEWSNVTSGQTTVEPERWSNQVCAKYLKPGVTNLAAGACSRNVR